MPHWTGARCLPPALVAWGAAIPTLTSSGTMLTAAAPATQRHPITHPNLLHLLSVKTFFFFFAEVGPTGLAIGKNTLVALPLLVLW